MECILSVVLILLVAALLLLFIIYGETVRAMGRQEPRRDGPPLRIIRIWRVR
jgi:hypothetical protein